MKILPCLTALTLSAVCSLSGADALPTVDQILAKNIEAMGGKVAIEKVKSQVLKGKLTSPMIGEIAFELSAKAPNQRVSVLEIPSFGTLREGCDGKIAWSDNPQTGLTEKQGAELERARREAVLHGILKMKELFPQVTVKTKQRLDSREVYVVEAKPPTGSPEVLYYDTKSGLLVRREFQTEGEGGAQIQLDFDDYRTVEGVKFPFTTKMPKPEVMQFTLAITEVKVNVPLADSLFAKPTPK